jgi:hypothetical protein
MLEMEKIERLLELVRICHRPEDSKQATDLLQGKAFQKSIHIAETDYKPTISPTLKNRVDMVFFVDITIQSNTGPQGRKGCPAVDEAFEAVEGNCAATSWQV